MNEAIMKLTLKQKQHIKVHWHYYPHMRFLRDGTVMCKRSFSESWGILYTPRDTKRHLQAVGLLS